MKKIKVLSENIRRKYRAKIAKKRTAKIEKKMDKLAQKADKICRNPADFNTLANKIFDKRDYRIYMSRFIHHKYEIE